MSKDVQETINQIASMQQYTLQYLFQELFEGSKRVANPGLKYKRVYFHVRRE